MKQSYECLGFIILAQTFANADIKPVRIVPLVLLIDNVHTLRDLTHANVIGQLSSGSFPLVFITAKLNISFRQYCIKECAS